MKTSKTNQVGNFEQLVSFINAQGAVYNPSKASIKGAALQTLLTQSQGAMKAADVSRNAYDQAINARQQVFRTLPKLSGRVLAYLQLVDASPEVIDECRKIVSRLNGRVSRVDKAPLATPAPDAEGEKISRRISYLDKESVIRNFQILVDKAAAVPWYKPNETDLQAASLTALLTTLRDKNKAVKDAFVAVHNAVEVFNKTLFGANGIHDQAMAVKMYVRVLYGYQSPQHKQLTRLTFNTK